MSLEEIERAILVASDATRPESARATAALNQFQGTPNAWRTGLDLFLRSAHLKVKFYSLRILQNAIESGKISPEARREIKTSTFRFVSTHIQRNFPVFLWNKCALILSLLLKHNTGEWPNAFTELKSLLSLGQAGITLWLRVLSAVHEEIVRRDIHRTKQELSKNTNIKDSMRQGVVQDIVSTFAEILRRKDTSPNVSSDVLNTMSMYVHWIDLSLTMNMFPLIIHGLQNAVTRCASAKCVNALVAKGMSSENKLTVLRQTNVLDTLRRVASQTHLDDSFAVELARVVNEVGITVLSIRKENIANESITRHMLRNVVDFALSLLGTTSLSFQTPQQLLTFLQGFAHVSCKSRESWLAEFDLRLLNCLLIRLRCSSNFHFGEDADEAEFLDYRKDILLVVQRIQKHRPHIVLAFLRSRVEVVSNSLNDINSSSSSEKMYLSHLSSYNYLRVEAYITMLDRFGSGGNVKFCKQSKEFHDLIDSIHHSDITNHNHFAVQMAYLDLALRYTFVISNNPSRLVPRVMGIVLSAVRNSKNKSVRSRASYVTLRLIKSLKDKINPFLAMMMENIIRFFSDNDVTKNTLLTFEDQLHLYNSMGVMISAPWIPDQFKGNDQLRVTRSVLEPMMRRLSESVHATSSSSSSASAKLKLGTFASRILDASACVLHGFDKKDVAIIPLARTVIKACCTTLRALPCHKQIRGKSIVLFHRTLWAMEVFNSKDCDLMSNATAPLVLHSLENCDDILAVIQFVNLSLKRLPTQYGVPIVRDHLVSLIKQVFNSLPRLEDPSDVAAVQNSYFHFISRICSQDILRSILLKQGPELLRNVLNTILQGCVQDVTNAKLCFQIWQQLASCWLTSKMKDGAQVRIAFAKFVYDHVTSTIFEIPMRPEFDLCDAKYNSLLKEIAKTLYCFIQALGLEYVNYICTKYLPHKGCPSGAVNALGVSLRNVVSTRSAAADMKKCLLSFFKGLKSRG